MPVQFTATVELRGVNPYVLVSADHAQQLEPGWRKPMPVRVRINGAADPEWRINMMPVGDGGFLLYLDGRLRDRTGVGVGDVVTVCLAFDAAYRAGPQHEAPAVFTSALERRPDAKARWVALAPSRQKEVLRYLAGLKTEGARARNVDRAIRVLGGAKERFMARDWN